MTIKEFFEMIFNANYCKMKLGEGTKYLVKILTADGEQIGIDTDCYDVFVKIIKDNFKSKRAKEILASVVCSTRTNRKFELFNENATFEEKLFLIVE